MPRRLVARSQVWFSVHNFFKYFFIWLHWFLVVAHGLFNLCCSMQTLSFSMQNLVPWPGMKYSPLPLEAWSPSHRITREVPCEIFYFLGFFFWKFFKNYFSLYTFKIKHNDECDKSVPKVPSSYISTHVCLVSSVMLNSATLWTVANQAPLSMGILQARILEWVAMPSSRGSSQPRDWTQVSCVAGRFFTIWASREAQNITYIQ